MVTDCDRWLATVIKSAKIVVGSALEHDVQFFHLLGHIAKWTDSEFVTRM